MGYAEIKALWEHPNREAQQAIGHLEEVLAADFRAEVKFDHHVYRSDS